MSNPTQQPYEPAVAVLDPAEHGSGPVDHGDWDPALPSIRSLAPSAIGGAIVPLAVYYLVRSHVGNDANALAIAGVPAAAWVLVQFLRRRRIDPIGAIVLFGFVLGLVVSYALGGDAFVLKVRDSGFTFLFGLASVVTTRFGRRPVIFYIGRALASGGGPERRARYDRLWEAPAARATFRLISLMWGFGLMADAVTRVILAADLSTSSFLAASPVAGGAYVGVMVAATAWLVARSRARATQVSPAAIPKGGWWHLVVAPGLPSSGRAARQSPAEDLSEERSIGRPAGPGSRRIPSGAPTPLEPSQLDPSNRGLPRK